MKNNKELACRQLYKVRQVHDNNLIYTNKKKIKRKNTEIT